jgi:GNAT superfamily N-acetyltransferase
MPELKIVPVRDKRGTADFIRVPFALYRNDPNWVPQLNLERREHLDPNKNPYFQHADAQLFVAYHGDEPVGRISAQIDRLRLEQYQDSTGQFGFIEAPDDFQISKALLETAESWLTERGIHRVQGPFNFSINDEVGLLVSGFDRPPAIMMGHALPYMAAHLEARGYSKAKDVIAYDYDGSQPLPRAMQHLIDKTTKSGEIRIRPFSKKNLDRDLQIVMSIFNDAWSDNWGFVPFTAAEMKMLGNNLKMLVKDEYIAIAEYRGEVAAMAVTLPDINGWIADLDGRLLPFGWAKLAWRLLARPPAAVRMPLMGVLKKYHSTATGSALALAVIDNLRRYHLGRGTVRSELSWILEDNKPMRRIIEQLGGVPYKTYRIYQKTLV